ncbi:hypothetical protein RHMOL_Rhmol13G0286700 [Rhododendron molle]|uniref:Uncharacterized protein n=1 Tax=Rhododendron molle TaxID=49168 RepID=A0ACC0LBQ2_RHOML|nr:hypothetical protein RHMOL_Rhmol13G0286700 [Rhododendron molle]
MWLSLGVEGAVWKAKKPKVGVDVEWKRDLADDHVVVSAVVEIFEGGADAAAVVVVHVAAAVCCSISYSCARDKSSFRVRERMARWFCRFVFLRRTHYPNHQVQVVLEEALISSSTHSIRHPNPIIKLIPPPPYPPSPLFQKNNSAETQPKTIRVCPSPSSSALLRNLKSQPQILEDSVSATPESSAKLDSVNGSSKVPISLLFVNI